MSEEQVVGPTVAENEDLPVEQPTTMQTDEEANNGAPVEEVAETNGNGLAATNEEADVEGKIFLGGLTWQTTDEMLKAHFGKWGALNDVILMRNKITGEPRGFGFVQFQDSSSADAALKEEHVIDGRTIDVKRAVPRDRAPQPRATTDRQSNSRGGSQIFVGGLDQEVNDADFKGYFAKYGKVEDAVVMYDKKTGRSRGFGFITYDSPDIVRKVMNGGTHVIKGKSVEVKTAAPRDGPRPYNGGGGGGGYGGGGGGGGYSGQQGWSQQGGYGGDRGGGGSGGGGYGGGGGYNQGGDRGSQGGYGYGGQQGYGYGYNQQGGYGGGYTQEQGNYAAGGYNQGYGQGAAATPSRSTQSASSGYNQGGATTQGYGSQTGYSQGGYQQQQGYGATSGQTATTGYGTSYAGTEATGNGSYGAGSSTSGYGTGTAVADQGGYGAYRGGAATQGRQDRSYRPY